MEYRQDGSNETHDTGHRVLIGDEQTMLVDLLRTLLQPEFQVVGIVRDGLQLATKAAELQPDIAILDVNMPGCSGIEAARQMLIARPTVRLVFLTMQEDPSSAAEAFAAGAQAYALKSQSAGEFLRALREVAAGNRYLAPSIAGGDLTALAVNRRDGLNRISAREREVLGMLVSGLPMKAVARKLGITPRTVAFHKYKAMETLGLRDNAQLLEFALRYRLLHADVHSARG